VDPNAPIKGKCVWWREFPNEEDTYNVRVKEHDKRVNCSCFVEGRRGLSRVPMCPPTVRTRAHAATTFGTRLRSGARTRKEQRVSLKRRGLPAALRCWHAIRYTADMNYCRSEA